MCTLNSGCACLPRVEAWLWKQRRVCGDARGLKEVAPTSCASQSVRGSVRGHTCAVRTTDANMGSGVCARQLARSSRGIFAAVIGGQQNEGLVNKGLMRRLSTETNKIEIQAEQAKIEPAR